MLRTLFIALCFITLADYFCKRVESSQPQPKIEIVEHLRINEPVDLGKMITKEDVDCLTENVYFEARNQTIEGQYAVAEVVVNRANDSRFPDSICGVVKQKSYDVCQFSWYCDGKSDQMNDKRAIKLARKVAVDVLFSKTNYTKGAIFYHADYVSPEWKNVKKIVKIQDHIFYTNI